MDEHSKEVETFHESEARRTRVETVVQLRMKQVEEHLAELTRVLSVNMKTLASTPTPKSVVQSAELMELANAAARQRELQASLLKELADLQGYLDRRWKWWPLGISVVSLAVSVATFLTRKN
jgi:hypothetical protein